MSGVILAVPDRPEVAPRVLAAAACLAELTRSEPDQCARGPHAAFVNHFAVGGDTEPAG